MLDARPAQHDAHIRAAIMSPDIYLPSASLARIGLADSSEHELDMVSWRDVACEWDLDRDTAEALLAEARSYLPPLEPPPAPRAVVRNHLADLADFRGPVTSSRDVHDLPPGFCPQHAEHVYVRDDHHDRPLTRAGAGRAHLARGRQPDLSDEGVARFLAVTV